MSKQPGLKNGQIWVQEDFPCFKVLVVMLDHVDGELMFCRLGVSESEVPMLMTDEKGTWMLNAKDMRQKLINLKYTFSGNGVITNKTR